MRHHNRLRKLDRTTAERRALLRDLVCALLKRQRIVTTLPKAKEARRLAEKVITIAKDASLASRRRLFAIFVDRTLVKELVTEIAPRFKNRNGGYTRIIKLSKRRKGDNAEVAILELTEQKVVVAPPKKAKKEAKPSVTEKTEEAAAPKEKEAPATKEEKKPQKEEAAKPETEEKKHPREERDTRKHHIEKGKKGFFQNLKKFLKPKTG